MDLFDAPPVSDVTGGRGEGAVGRDTGPSVCMCACCL